MPSTQALSGEQLKEEGNTAYQNGDYTASAQYFSAAAESFDSKNEHVLAAEMANNSSVAWLQAGENEKALELVEGTDAVFAAAGEIRLQAMALGNKAAALDAMGRIDEAVILYEQSAELLEGIGEGELRAYILQSISKIQFRTGRQFEALSSMHAGIEGIKKPTLRHRILKRLLRIPMRGLGVRLKD